MLGAVVHVPICEADLAGFRRRNLIGWITLDPLRLKVEGGKRDRFLFCYRRSWPRTSSVVSHSRGVHRT
jgi:hypothetical protein